MIKELDTLLNVRKQRADKVAASYQKKLAELRKTKANKVASENYVEQLLKEEQEIKDTLRRYITHQTIDIATIRSWKATQDKLAGEVTNAYNAVIEWSETIEHLEAELIGIHKEHKKCQIALEKIHILREHLIKNL